jgi:hypothetical protein
VIERSQQPLTQVESATLSMLMVARSKDSDDSGLLGRNDGQSAILHEIGVDTGAS